MNTNKIKENALQLISESKVSDAFALLLNSLNEGDKRDIIVNMQRFSSIKREYNNGLIDYSTKQLLTNQVVNSLVEFIQDNNFNTSENINKSIIKIYKPNDKTINLIYIHYYSGTSYNVEISNESKAILLLNEIKKIVEEKHKMILRMKGGGELDLDLFNETKEKQLNLEKSLVQNGVEEDDIISLMIKPK